MRCLSAWAKVWSMFLLRLMDPDIAECHDCKTILASLCNNPAHKYIVYDCTKSPPPFHSIIHVTLGSRVQLISDMLGVIFLESASLLSLLPWVGVRLCLVYILPSPELALSGITGYVPFSFRLFQCTFGVKHYRYDKFSALTVILNQHNVTLMLRLLGRHYMWGTKVIFVVCTAPGCIYIYISLFSPFYSCQFKL